MGTQSLTDSWSKTTLWFQHRQQLQATINQQQSLLQQQATVLMQLHALHDENRQLRALLHLPQQHDVHWQAVRVLGHSAERISRRLQVAVKGAAQGQAVIAPHGLVGVVDVSDAEYATIRTLMDPALVIPVRLKERPLAAVCRAHGMTLHIDFIPFADAPKVGTILYTSGAGGLFPSGIPVAKVSRVQAIKGQLFADIEAEAMAYWQADAWLAIAMPQH